MAAKKKPLSFEDGLERLESIAAQMEHGALPLDELMKLYEEGIKLSSELSQKLEAANGRLMEVRAARDGKLVVDECNVVQQNTLLDGLVDE